MNPLSNIISLVENERCCLRCVGRGFGKKNVLNINSSLEISQTLPNNLKELTSREENCPICNGAVQRSISLVESILKKLSNIEFNSFLIGCQLSKSQQQGDTIYKKHNLNPITLKHEIAREIGLRISDTIDKNVDFSDPEITIVIQPKNTPRFWLQIKSVYILGKYLKLIRGIPQTKWPCTYCKGKGCNSCNQSGQQYPHSVEGIIAKPIFELARSKRASFHGAGREDIDALMLGTGRPFVLEIKNPIKRSFDLSIAEKLVNSSNMVEIHNLRFCDKSIIKKIKEESSEIKKTYRAKVILDLIPKDEDIANLAKFGKNKNVIHQRTPTRVSHRRANKVRMKYLYDLEISNYSNYSFELEITAQGGTYIKEFISGDNGRTVPSISSILKVNAICKALDVIAVDHKELFNERLFNNN